MTTVQPPDQAAGVRSLGTYFDDPTERDDELLAYFREPVEGARSARYCRRVCVVTLDPTDGTVARFPRQCRSLAWCERCHDDRASSVLGWARRRFGEWFVFVAVVEGDSRRLRTRISRRAMRAGAEYMVVRHCWGNLELVWIFASKDLGAGRRVNPPVSCRSVQAIPALEELRDALMFGAVRGVSWSEGWRPPRPRRTRKLLGHPPDEIWGPAWDRACTRAEAICDARPTLNRPLPSDLDPATFELILREELAAEGHQVALEPQDSYDDLMTFERRDVSTEIGYTR